MLCTKTTQAAKPLIWLSGVVGARKIGPYSVLVLRMGRNRASERTNPLRVGREQLKFQLWDDVLADNHDYRQTMIHRLG